MSAPLLATKALHFMIVTICGSPTNLSIDDTMVFQGDTSQIWDHDLDRCHEPNEIEAEVANHMFIEEAKNK